MRKKAKKTIKEIIHTDWDKLKAFYYVAQAKSFTKAGLQLNLSQSALSRSIQTFEEALGYPLFIRGKRAGTTLTEEGQILWEATQDVRATLMLAENKIEESHNSPAGFLKIAPVVGLFTAYLSSHVGDFLKKYPDMRVNFFETDNAPSLELCEVDILIHPFMEDQASFIQRPLMKLHLSLYASPEYLNQFGAPKSVADLKNHRLIAGTRYGHQVMNANWILTVGLKPGQMREPYVEVNSGMGRLLMAQQGLGIAALPQEQPGLKESGLVPVLPDLKGATVEFYYIYSNALQNSKRVNVLFDYLYEVFKNK